MRTYALLAVLALATLFLSGCTSSHGDDGAASQELLNVSYDPTRELWKALNKEFIADYKKQTGVSLDIRQSHAGSSSQARSVVEGLDADVVTLAMPTDTEAIAKAGLIKEGWQERLPNGSLPYSSTIVFVVRKGNPKQVKDWSDLVRDDVTVVTPSAKTSGNGKLSFLAAWGSVVLRGGSESDATQFVRQLYQHVPVLDSGACAATTTFAQKKIGDVHLTWENEAFFEMKEAGGELEIVYPPLSIRAEPRVAVVDANVDRKKTRAAAEAYLEFLYTPKRKKSSPRIITGPSSPRSCTRTRSRSSRSSCSPSSRSPTTGPRPRPGSLPMAACSTRSTAPRSNSHRTAAPFYIPRTRPIMSKTNRHVLPGFSLSLGYTLLYLSLLTMVPLVACFSKAFSLSFDQFWAAVWTPRAVAAYQFSFMAAFVSSIASVVLGFIIAWVLVRYEFPLKRFFDSLIDLPFALPTAVAGLVYSGLYVENGWLGQFLVPLGIHGAYSRFAVVLVLTFLGIPFVVRTLEPVLDSLEADKEEAAHLLGASRGQTFCASFFPRSSRPRSPVSPSRWPAG